MTHHPDELWTVPIGEYEIRQNPKLSDWQCEMFGTGQTGMIMRPVEGAEPNWFWRKMQFLILGNRWVRVGPLPLKEKGTEKQ